jgi:hypothetical protein
MILIAHRGNYKGTNKERENAPDYIEEAISAGYNVEVDVWLIDGKWMLGHDFPMYEVPLSFFERPQVWTHTKNLIGYVSLYHNKNAHVFWHDEDEFVFTSKGIKWARSGVRTHDGIVVMPEWDEDITEDLTFRILEPLGVCSDDFNRFNLQL